MNWLKDLFFGIKKHPWGTAGNVFAVFSILNTLLTGVNYFVPSIKFEGNTPLWIALGISILVGCLRVAKPSRIEIPIAHCNTVIEVVFGNLFEQKGIRAIAVTEYFESKIGAPVSDKSIHGIFLKQCFGGSPEGFDKQIEEQLKSETFSTEQSKTEGKNKRYAIGTTAVVTAANADRYLIFALSKADPKTCKATADVSMMWDALHKLWERARAETGGHDLNLPLVGGGLSGIGLPARDLLNLIILSAITETKAQAITQRIRIVLFRDSQTEDLDLRDLKKYWQQ